MDSVAKRDPEDSAKIKAIEQKLLANPEMAKLIDADNGNTGSEPRGMTHFLTGHDLLMCLQRDLSSMLVPTLYRNPVNPPMTL